MAGKLTRWVALGLLVTLAAPADAQRHALPPELQKQVNAAIDRGVACLRQAQGPVGVWPNDNRHLAAYAALPGLTLLECGVPASDPAVQRAAAFVRAAAPGLDRTYEISLAILFLDRLGDPADVPAIEMLALRLAAGQTATGGWTYKCPVLNQPTHQELITILRKIDRPWPDPLDRPELARHDPLRKPPANPEPPVPLGKDGRPLPIPIEENRPGQDPLRKGGNNDRNPLATGQPRLGTGLLGRESVSPGEASQREESGGRLPFGSPDGGGFLPGPLDFGAQPPAAGDAPPRVWTRCFKLADPPAAAEPDDETTPLRIPKRLAGLPVLRDPRTLVPVDPPRQGQLPTWGTTDNSNTQFAILGMWAARRHGFPATRTLNLIVYRFVTSQNADGSWGYRYAFGGGVEERHTMDCVGLLGLAVGHGLARNKPAPGPNGQALARDPRVVGGLTALSKHIGVATGQAQNLPMENLYFLWSLERVGVLYGLGEIGGRDWYHWGSEILVANQQGGGHWQDGKYVGANPVVDTCLALLFLKKVNLTPDLQLPFRPEELAKQIPVALGAPPLQHPDPVEAADEGGMERGPAPVELGETPIAAEPPPNAPTAAPLPAPVVPATPAPAPPTAAVSKVGLLLLALGGILVLIGVGVALLLPGLRRRGENEDGEPPARRRTGGRRRKQGARAGRGAV